MIFEVPPLDPAATPATTVALPFSLPLLGLDETCA
jgi:hypothetical protein